MRKGKRNFAWAGTLALLMVYSQTGHAQFRQEPGRSTMTADPK